MNQCAIGVDLGGTSIKFGLLTLQGEVVEKIHRKTPRSKDFFHVVDVIDRGVRDLFENSKYKKDQCAGIGIGIPGVCDGEGEVIFANNLHWKNKPLKDVLEKRIGLPVKVGNDATLATVGEYKFGMLKDCRNGILLTLGTGLGAGVIIEGKIFHGSHYLGTEIGHTIIGDNFYQCNCGNYGCLETFASATAMIRYARKLLETEPSSFLQTKTKGDPFRLNVEMIFEGVKSGDRVSEKTLKRFIHYLSMGISNLINIFDPEVIALGGGVSYGADVFLEDLREKTKEYTYVREKNPTRIEIAQLKNDAGLMGAAGFVTE